MARRHKLWAAATRQRMTMILGGQCACCGSAEKLTFDCIEPMGHDHHRKNAPERISFYRKQMRAGNVQLLCESCNGLKADLRYGLWLQALCRLRAAEFCLRPAWSPGRGTTVTPGQRVELLRAILAEQTT
jgi:hypothetical protein